MKTPRFNDFRQKLIDLQGKRVRLCFYIQEIARHWATVGRIISIDEKTKSLEFEIDPSDTGDYPITRTWHNLDEGATVIYAVDLIPEDAVLKQDEEKAEHIGLRTEYIPYDKEGKPLREPQEGYVILHKDHIYSKGTVYTLLRDGESQQSKEKTIE